ALAHRSTGSPSRFDRVWTSRSLRPVSPEGYAFRMGPLRRRVWAHPGMPEARPEKPVQSCSPSLTVLTETSSGPARACLHPARHRAQPAARNNRPIERLNARLIAKRAVLLARFRELQLGC